MEPTSRPAPSRMWFRRAISFFPSLAVWRALLLLLIPVVILVATAAGLVNGFTTVFIVPVMVLEDCGVLAGWRRL